MGPEVAEREWCYWQDESSIAAHFGERAPKLAEDESAAPDPQDGGDNAEDQDVSVHDSGTSPCLILDIHTTGTPVGCNPVSSVGTC